MALEDHITAWISELKDGDEQAAQILWEKYVTQLISLIRRHLDSRQRRVSDEDDIVTSAFFSFYRRATANQFPQLNDREDLWKILVTITFRKVYKQRRRLFAEKRGEGKIRGESVFLSEEDSSQFQGLAQVIERGPTPEQAVVATEALQEMLELLQDETLQQIVLLRFEGYDNREIAAKVGCKLRSVERKLGIIRRKWADLVELRDVQ